MPSPELNPAYPIEQLNARTLGTLPGWFGLRVVSLAAGRLAAEMSIRPDMLAPNGYLHAASLVALADTSCGLATMAHLPAGASGFTTIELKTNFLGTRRDGRLECSAAAVHCGRNTHVWDAEVYAQDGARLALFRCTQMILWPKSR